MENLQNNKLSSECLEDQLIYEDYRDKVKRGIIDINEQILLKNDDMCIMMLHWAVLMTDEEFIDYLLVNKVDIDAQINFLKGTALMVAVRDKKFDIVKKLINGGADVNALGMPTINRYNVPRMTPLAIAVENEDFCTAELLIDSGAKFYMVPKTDLTWTALTVAIFRQNERMVKLLLKNEDEIESKEEKEFLTSYIYQAIKNGTDEIVKIIWPYYPRGSALWIDYVNQIPRILVEKNSTELLKYFLNNYDFDINVATKRYRWSRSTNFYNHSMLHTAVEENSNETMVKYLLDAGIDVNIGPGTPAIECSEPSYGDPPNRVVPMIKEHLVKMIACNYAVSEINLQNINLRMIL
ncbi:uncharacterized protein LOC130665963 [Microplitis mediator]|uniref:uncharacterized protein LOC130665963 n=1 Tax=Microplitis mediator TaxID=375433 RepID=UPI00255689B5|nr:uncharacterized protein LOC130665963 [Microplitis mediator]